MINARLNLKFISLLTILIYSNNILSQNKVIDGETVNQKKSDTISFVNGIMNKKYYEHAIITSEVIDNRFKIDVFLSYPQMYFLSWKSEKNNVLFYGDPFFIDSSTKKIFARETNCEVDGDSFLEFKNEFLPFILKESNLANINDYLFENGNKFDSRLASYVSNKNDSYVALWFLVKRFNENGYSSLYEEILNSFSKKIKSGKLWMILNQEFKNITIKENKKFPDLHLKNTDLKEDVLKIPNAEFTLIDFWFSRCRPCLEQMPLLKEIYSNYNSKGFNILGISTDKTVNLEIWKKRIIEKEIPWQNYLDENAVLATNEKIFSYPTNFLLDKNGKVLKKNINPVDLQKFLKENLNK
ncbi:TlpA family protein disulfide reductase [Flavobacterium daemonense]|uniref:TlpA family protein disulfide reductase n=1 Tax=Flavobacterium daemonense TaxID=1393049 RepID=UPI0013A67046|nr:TlpA disulfide reductase family protein [Flavobacterium daemonense]KAF2329090.1 TlpA family protein disulfide reductase [Flavobacterium daemonense]